MSLRSNVLPNELAGLGAGCAGMSVREVFCRIVFVVPLANLDLAAGG